MNFNITNITIAELVKNYSNNDEEGVKGYNNLLNIRPPYQREFCYNDKQRNAVIDTVIQKAPLSLIYWVQNTDGTFELLDGQQRTISICEFVNGSFSIEIGGLPKYFHTLSKEEKESILNYPLMVCICDGDHKERLEWFKRINIAGEKLTDQELLNINYIGTWLSDAKRLFSKTNCWAYRLANKYVKGSPIRQEYLETVLDWISNGNIAEYMADHQREPNANELKMYFLNVIEWVNTTFGEQNYRKEMLGINWDVYIIPIILIHMMQPNLN